jgi:hypothetical protein
MTPESNHRLQSLGKRRLLQWAALVVSLTREREQHA